jgi:hypothetical protein
MIAQLNSPVHDNQVTPEPMGRVIQAAGPDNKIPIVNQIFSEVNRKIDRTNLEPGILDKIHSPIHIFSVSAAALFFFLFLWFLSKSL